MRSETLEVGSEIEEEFAWANPHGTPSSHHPPARGGIGEAGSGIEKGLAEVIPDGLPTSNISHLTSGTVKTGANYREVNIW
jgi:hypothetical protein